MTTERTRESRTGAARAGGEGTGRMATLKQAWAESKRDRLPLVAAGVAFYGFLAMIPTLIAAVLVYGLVSDPEDVTGQIEEYATALPDSAQQLLTEQLSSVAEGQPQTLSISLVIALAVALWSASTGVANLITAVNIAYNAEESRGFIAKRAIALLFTLGAIVFMLVALALVAVLPVVANALDLPGWATIVLEIGRWVILLFAVLAALGVLYRWAPTRETSGFRLFSFGAVLATILWVVISVGFSIYVNNFGNYGETYGSLAGVVVLLLWMWLSAFAALFGAEVNAASEPAAEPTRPAEPARPAE